MTAVGEPTMGALSGKTAIVVGASRGLGRAIATAFAEAGANAIAVSRSKAAFPEPTNGHKQHPAGVRRCRRRHGASQAFRPP